MSANPDARWSDDRTRVKHVIIHSFFSCIALFAVILRLWARKMQRSTLARDDYLCVAGLAFTLALAMFDVYSNVYWDLGGVLTQKGQPAAILSLVIIQVKAMLAGQILWITAVSLIRASVLCLYTHIFRTKSFRNCCHIVQVLNCLYCGSTILAACLICQPLAAHWDVTVGHCGKQKSLDLFIGVFNLLMDVCVVILPMPVLWHLQMSNGNKAILSGIFGMGIVICAVTLERIRVTTLIHDGNQQKIYSLIALFACLEAQLGVVNSCLPVMRPVFTKLHSKAWAWASGYSNTSLQRPNNLSSGGQYLQQSSRKGGSNNQRLRSRPSPTDGSIAPQHVGDKAVRMIFGNDETHASTDVLSLPPQVLPKSKYYSSENTFYSQAKCEMPKSPRITVQGGWDVEKQSSETERIVLTEKGKVPRQR